MNMYRGATCRRLEFIFDGDVLEEVDRFCYLYDMFDSHSGVNDAVGYRVFLIPGRN